MRVQDVFQKNRYYACIINDTIRAECVSNMKMKIPRFRVRWLLFLFLFFLFLKDLLAHCTLDSRTKNMLKVMLFYGGICSLVALTTPPSERSESKAEHVV